MKHLKEYKLYESFRPIISYDFDGVLHRSVRGIHPISFDNYRGWEPFEEMHKQMIEDAEDHDIVVITARPPETSKYVDAFIKMYNLPVSKVFYTDNGPKVDTLVQIGAIKHYDDNIKMSDELADTGIEFQFVNPMVRESVNEMMDGYKDNGIVLLIGPELEDGTHRLYGAHVKKVLSYDRNKRGGEPGQAAKMVLLYDDTYRITMKDGVLSAGKTMNGNQAAGISSRRIVLNDNKTPKHWLTTKYQHFPLLFRELSSVIGNLPAIRWYN